VLFGEVSTTEGAGYPGGLIAFLTAVEDVPDAGGNPFVSYARGRAGQWRPAGRRGGARACRCRGRSGRSAMRAAAAGRYGARPSKRALDVLMMNERLDQADPAAQHSGHPARFRVIA
jgi:hypothetical protein